MGKTLTLFFKKIILGPKPCESLRTKSVFPLGGNPDKSHWTACYKLHNGRCLSVSVCPPANACIGCYSLTMSLVSCDHTHSENLGHFYVLFNPWCSGKIKLSVTLQNRQLLLSVLGSEECIFWIYLYFTSGKNKQALIGRYQAHLSRRRRSKYCILYRHCIFRYLLINLNLLGKYLLIR